MIELGELLELETRVWSALQSGDAAADMASLSEDFLGVYPSGFATREDHGDQLGDGPTVAEFALSDARMMSVSETDLLLSYRADFTRPSEDALLTWFISSLWSLRDGRWVNTFSQDTPAAKPETGAS